MNRHPVRTNRGQAIFVEYRLALFTGRDTADIMADFELKELSFG